ncbi:MAG: hypothetical protein IK090_05755 [Clostridia bacterium]|nr:hypothetical protein [Clostridia bacterium]
MKKVISLLLLVGLLVGSTVVFTSCGKSKEPVGGGAQISVYLSGEITNLDPQSNQTNDAVLSVIRLIFEPLFTVEPDGDLVLAGAKKYKIDKSEGKVTIDLRESYWNDGSTLVRASDYVYAWKKLIRSDTDNPAATLLYDVKNAVKIKQGLERLDNLGVVAIDNDTLEITFEEGFTAYDTFLRNLANVALSPLNEKAVNNREYYWGKTASTISSNGPFRVTSLDFVEGSFRLDRNRSYHRPAGSKSTVDAYVIPAALKTLWKIGAKLTDEEYLAQMIDGLMEKTIFYVGEIPQNLREEKRSSAVITDTLSTYSYVFNCANPLFTDPAVRKELSDVIDREEIARIAVYGKAATGLIPKTVSEGSKYNAWTATTPLSTTATTVTGGRSGAFTLTYREGTINKQIAEYVKGRWESLGYTVTLEEVSREFEALDPSTGVPVSPNAEERMVTYVDILQTKFAARDYDVIAIDYQMYSTNALAVLSTFTSEMNGGGMIADPIVPGNPTLDELINNTSEPSYTLRGNRMNYVSAAFDEKMAAAYAEKDLAARNTLLHEAEAILLAEMPVIPLLFNQRAYLSSSEISGLSVDRYGFVSFTSVKQKHYEDYLAATQAPAREEETTAGDDED